MSKPIVLSTFSKTLRNRNHKQTDGLHTGIEFRTKFLSGDVDTAAWWKDPTKTITVDFTGIDTLGPSWANEVFAYFTRYDVDYDVISKKFGFQNLDAFWEEIVRTEVTQGYRGEN